MIKSIIGALSVILSEFLLTLDNHEKHEWYATNRQLAEVFIKQFFNWIMEKNNGK